MWLFGKHGKECRRNMHVILALYCISIGNEICTVFQCTVFQLEMNTFFHFSHSYTLCFRYVDGTRSRTRRYILEVIFVLNTTTVD